MWYVCTCLWWTWLFSVACDQRDMFTHSRTPFWSPAKTQMLHLVSYFVSDSFVYLNNNIHTASPWLVPRRVWRCIWMLFCPAGLSSVGLIIVVISLGSIREAQETGSPWKSHDGRRSADVQVPASRLSPAQAQPQGEKERGRSDQPMKDWRAKVRLSQCCLPETRGLKLMVKKRLISKWISWISV